MFSGMIKLAVRANRKLKVSCRRENDYNRGLFLIYEQAFFSTYWITVLFINPANVHNHHCVAQKQQALELTPTKQEEHLISSLLS